MFLDEIPSVANDWNEAGEQIDLQSSIVVVTTGCWCHLQILKGSVRDSCRVHAKV